MRKIVFLLILNLFTLICHSQVNLPLGLVAHYTFSGNPNDISGNNHNGQLVNGPTLTTDRFGTPNSAYYFDGIDDYIRVPDDGNFSTPLMSVSFWFNTESSALQNLIAKRSFPDDGTPAGGAQYQFFINHATLGKIASNLVGNNNTCANVNQSNYIKTNDLICNNKWYFGTVTFDGTTHKLYINGVLKTQSVTNFNTRLNCNSEVRFGNWWQLDLLPFKGILDDIRWYNRPLNKAEIDALYGNFRLAGNNWLQTPSLPSYVTTGDVDVPGNQITVEALFNRAPPLNNGLYYGHLVSKHTDASNVNYALLPNGCEITTSVSGYVSTFQTCPPDLNRTYHVAMVYNGSSLKFYRDGFLLSQVPCTGNMVVNDLATTIAQVAGGSNPLNNQFLGYTNEVRIWNVARTQTEIRAYMNNTLPNPTTQAGLVAYYTFDDLLNKQGNAAYNGTLNGAAILNTTNPLCEFVVDSCNVLVCQTNTDFSSGRNPCNTLSATFQTNNTDYNSISWDFGDGNSASNSGNVTHVYNNYGNYVVRMIQNFPSCSDTVIKTITIDLQGDNNLVLTPDTLICLGASKKIRTAPALNYCWSPSTYLDNPNIPEPTTSALQSITYYYTAEVTGPNQVINGDFSSGNTGFTSQYNFANPNIAEAQYYVGINPTVWNSAMNSCIDHTNSSFNMMLVNGSPNPGDRIWSQTINVVPNTNYAFSTWIQSLNNVNPANLQFSINNVIVGNNITASNQPCLWNRFFINWNSGNNTSATITIVNNNIIRVGNDFALDDISFAPVFMKRDSIKILVDSPFIKTNNDTTICEGKTVQLNTTTAQFYLWSPAASLSNSTIANPVASPVITTQYFVSGTNANGCIAKDTVNIFVNAKPQITRSGDTNICKNTTTQLFASGGNQYLWSPAASLNNPNISNPVASPTANTIYHVSVTDSRNCSNTDSVIVNVVSPAQFTITNTNLSVCKNESIQLLASGGNIYAWSPAASLDNPSIANPVASPTISTNYSVTITETTCNESATLFVPVIVLALPAVKATKSNDIDCTIGTAQLSATGASQYIWSPTATLNNAASSTPIANPSVTTQYSVTGTDQFGCTNKDSVTVAVGFTNNGNYLMASAFTPNNDGLNDCFGIKYWGPILELEFNIYNRWGERVFHTTNPADCWNGKYKGVEQKTDVYVYWIRAKTVCEPLLFRKGTVTLIK